MRYLLYKIFLVLAGVLLFASTVKADESEESIFDGIPIVEPILEPIIVPIIDGADNYFRQEGTVCSLSVENDLFGFNNNDRYYTSGIRLTRLAVRDDSLPDYWADPVLQFIGLDNPDAVTLSVGQKMFTPTDITIAAPQPEERPWAGWLYISTGAIKAVDNHIDEVEFTLGMVGPAAATRQSQSIIHHIINSPQPQGWHNQLDNELGVIFGFERRWPQLIHTELPLGLETGITPYLGVRLGNVHTYGSLGFSVHLGSDSNAWQDTPPRPLPAMPRTGYYGDVEDTGHLFQWYLFGGMEARAVARNIFLDGNTFGSSPSVNRDLIAYEATMGIAANIGRYRLSYSQIIRSKEFDNQPELHSFGSLNLSLRF